ncbi:Uncharacterised protein [Mycobacteroides abscessus subsp. abscessus]|uniref:hypothetical protein n=1 Tax=Mycobacteroides abscessus TaxID=36809 RepID=UPI000928C94F|nr:hypothetical protein [Mycobacteroides abscessus]SIM25418.1 Uncharacterised protein [Mycobacteroides abscessus subsp. abscessus]SLC78920.1 Uncharacterised protein [Mycobacteroides abscessus subsp. abscessus]
MSGNRFRPSGWAQLRESNAASVADIVSQRAGSREDSGLARGLAARGGRTVVSAFMTPAGERVLHRIGYGRVFKLVGVVVAIMAITLAAFFAMAMAAITATGPVSIAGKLIPDAANLFGTGEDVSGEQLAAAGRDGSITCHMRATVANSGTAPLDSAPTEAEQVADSQTAPKPSPSPAAVEPIPIKEDGSVTKDDARTLVDPVLPGTSALQANVWFMYRAAGLGDWDTFTAAYRSAELRDDDQSPDAPLQQVQRLNSRGVDMEPYRLIAAALTSAGEVTGWLKDPYPGFRDLIVTELVSGCLDDDPASAERVKLPPPAATTTSGVEENPLPAGTEVDPELPAGE